MKGIVKGRTKAPDRIIISGTEGVGKTSFAASAPSPIFIASEDGAGAIGPDRFEEPKTFADILACVERLRKEEHDYRTLVIDSVDWVEPLIWKHVCKKNNWDDIETPGYGKGYIAALDQWRELISEFQLLREAKGVQIILTAHVTMKTFENPDGPNYTRYELAMNRQASALLKQWADSHLFAQHEVTIRKEKPKDVKGKATDQGRRLLHTTWRSAWDAKTRWAIPPVLPFDLGTAWENYERARDGSPELGSLVAEYRELVVVLPADKRKKAEAYLRENLGDANAVARGIEFLKSKNGADAAQKEEA